MGEGEFPEPTHIDDPATESPEEVLARLERYVESQRGAPPPPASMPQADTLVRPRSETARPRPLALVLQPVFAALSCTLAILAVEWFDSAVAASIAAALVLAGVIGLIRRVPFAGSWTAGFVVAGLLLRVS